MADIYVYALDPFIHAPSISLLPRNWRRRVFLTDWNLGINFGNIGSSSSYTESVVVRDRRKSHGSTRTRSRRASETVEIRRERSPVRIVREEVRREVPAERVVVEETRRETRRERSRGDSESSPIPLETSSRKK